MWEYKFLEVLFKELQEVLNAHSSENWELVTAVGEQLNGSTVRMYLFFKRPKQ